MKHTHAILVAQSFTVKLAWAATPIPFRASGSPAVAPHSMDIKSDANAEVKSRRTNYLRVMQRALDMFRTCTQVSSRSMDTTISSRVDKIRAPYALGSRKPF